MPFQLVSACCKTHYTEEASESNAVDHINVCSTCGMPCRLTRIGEPEGKPRTAQQAYNDSFDEQGNLREQGDSTILGDAPRPDNSLEIKDGKIYQNGKLIGTAVDDKTWYEQEFGEEWKGSEDALKKLRDR